MYDKLIPQGIHGVFGETSEITGAEHLAKARAASPEVAEKWFKTWKSYQDDVIEAHKTDDLSDSQPTKGNIAGGLTTIEEKALGNLEKIGRTCRYIDVLKPAEAPAKGPGLYYMDTSSAAGECVTLMAAAGYVVHTFPTGQGNVIGNPIIPVIKITGNPRTARTMSEHIDLDVSGILRREMTIDQAGDALIDMIGRTAAGRLTAAEALGHREFVMTKLYRSASRLANRALRVLPRGQRRQRIQPCWTRSTTRNGGATDRSVTGRSIGKFATSWYADWPKDSGNRVRFCRAKRSWRKNSG
jgi:(2R)-sulfolactate sulfo-lyase subunit beta